MPFYSETGNLAYLSPFDFGKSLNFIERFNPMMGQQQVTGSGALTKALMIDGQTVGCKVWSGDGCLQYRLFAEQTLSLETQRAVAECLRFFLSLDDDLAAFY